MRTAEFWVDAAERALKTLAQSLIAILAVGVPIWDINWVDGLGVALTATALSVLTSIASLGAGARDTASMVDGYPPRHSLED